MLLIGVLLSLLTTKAEAAPAKTLAVRPGFNRTLVSCEYPTLTAYSAGRLECSRTSLYEM